jgi:VanZ family protein
VPDLGVSDKFEHFSAYCVLGFFLNLTLKFQNRFKWLKNKAAEAAFTIAVVYAALDELHQLLIPSRDCDIKDWIADSIGVLIGLLIVYVGTKIYKSHLKKMTS